MMHQDIAVYLLEQLQKKGADDVVVQLGAAETQLLKFSNSKISTTKAWNATTLTVFAVKNQRIMLSSLKTLTKDAAKELAEHMAKSLNKIQPNKEYQGIAKGPCTYKKIPELYDPKIEHMDEEMIAMLKQAMDAAQKKAKRTAGTFEKNTGEIYLLTSNGVEANEKGTSLYFSLRALVDKNSSGYSSAVSRMKSKLDMVSTAEEAAAIAKQATLPKRTLSGTYDVLFAPHAFAAMIERMADSASIFSVESGLSCLQGKKNEQLAPSKVSIYDDATIANGYGSTPFDDEGTPTQKNAIIENGIMKNYLHNASTAKRYKTKSTGNAGLISPRIHNVSMKAGDYTKEELITSIKKGVYITNVWYTRFNNYQTGDFSTIPRDGAFYIENGKIRHALKDIRISENMLNIIKNISKLGKEIKQVKSWEVDIPTFVPHAVVKDVHITSPE